MGRVAGRTALGQPISVANSGCSRMGWTEAADLIVNGLNGAIGSKRVTYRFARLMEGATITCSAFGDNIIQPV